MAAEACVLILRRSREDFSDFRSVEFFSKDLSPVGKPDAAGDANGVRVRAGGCWTEDGADNYNLVFTSLPTSSIKNMVERPPFRSLRIAA